MNQIFKTHQTYKIVAVTTLALLLGACASTGTAPISEMAAARASITQAESAGALDLAPVDLLSARDKLSKAEAASQEKNYETAQQLAAKAQADAELAERKARAAKAQTAADELARSNELLRKEINRKVK
ncbi:MAG: hypothetical protein CVU29_08335 [Betaproteobacteria bacterium HGW-Betaproteobacteria-22]|nr:MAG: hypothetical protein CVU29_08335 [Betaproteobacteria bacterium HGW-Betaproteobacteria-22]